MSRGGRQEELGFLRLTGGMLVLTFLGHPALPRGGRQECIYVRSPTPGGMLFLAFCAHPRSPKGVGRRDSNAFGGHAISRIVGTSSTAQRVPA